ncbi:bifunctional NADP-dependent methylenetetrahydromethanopterin dehydrogenase/methylenetetrahydrofolate dehydrogenase [Zavarzinella formosa]|uniref:bifunctional NADP-dependent methylenetetrahydromethanopterin dehydrogenase/methylenetetrahydrofolate dehydrogenase n=1 Tax=Zavarzinella formosa TaxID=360055 RepID=UPI000313500B|nr:bifunctional NADP-dependent methylenetetrahydromethanopterin dehydrogenase/methylenetetrahydrofolate dehydrogenase [Zavarzinella formosa]
MSDKKKILIQLDTDNQASVFDRVVAVDAGTEFLFTHAGVTPVQVQALVHGAIFTRGPKDLMSTAVFVGGSDVSAGEAILAEVRKSLIPQYGLSVSVMLDSNGSNTTAAAAVRAAAKHMDLSKSKALVLGGTGPVGQRVARLLARQGAHVRIGSRGLDRAQAVCATIKARHANAQVEAIATGSSTDGPKALEGRDLVIAAGAAGAVLLPAKLRAQAKALRVAIDLNAVPPVGIEGVELGDKGVTKDGVICYGALGVGGTKMRIHKAAIAKLFQRNDLVLDAEEIYDLGEGL